MNHWLNEGKEIMKKDNKKHPYYDSDRKKKTEEFAMKAIAFVMLGFFAMYIVTMISQIFV